MQSPRKWVPLVVGGAATALLLWWGAAGLFTLMLVAAARVEQEQLLFAALNGLLLILMPLVAWAAFKAAGVGQPLGRAAIALVVLVLASLLVHGAAVALSYPIRTNYSAVRVIEVLRLVAIAAAGSLTFLWQARRWWRSTAPSRA